MPYRDRETRLSYGKWYRENVLTKEEVKIYNKEYRIKNKNKISEVQKVHRKENLEHIKNQKHEYHRTVGRLIRQKVKYTFFEMYGNKCACCGEAEKDFLTIDHINGQVGVPVNQKERGLKAYKKATEKYEPLIYRVLCYNCNCASGKLGYCPHSRIKNS